MAPLRENIAQCNHTVPSSRSKGVRLFIYSSGLTVILLATLELFTPHFSLMSRPYSVACHTLSHSVYRGLGMSAVAVGQYYAGDRLRL